MFHYVGFSPRKISVWEFQLNISEAVGGSLTGDHILKVSLSASRLEKVRRFWLFLIISAVFVCIFPITLGDFARS